MKKILCTTDFSENAEKALKYAYGLSRQFNSELIVLHVHDIPTILSGPSDAITADDISKGIEKMNLEKLCEICEDHLHFSRDNVSFEERENKSSVDGIVKMIDEIHPNMVVMGVKGTSRMKEVIMGSTSTGVIQKASCPVITIPEDCEVEPIIKKIVYATDLDDQNFKIINGLKEIATCFDADISVVHIVTESDKVTKEELEGFQNQLMKEVSYKKLHFEVLHSNRISERLYNYVADKNDSLIAMFEHENKSIFEHWFKKDLIKDVEQKSKIPFLSFNQNYLNTLQTTKKS